MLTLKIRFEDGNEIQTCFNGTVDDAVCYYIGKRFNIGIADDDLQKAVEISFLTEEGATYRGFECVWKLDRIYLADEKLAKEFDLQYPIRFASHVIEAPDDYEGVREMDAGWRTDSDVYDSIITGLTEAVDDVQSGSNLLKRNTICG